MGIEQHTDNNDTKIEGGTDGTTIGNVGDRLKVTAFTINLSDVPALPFATKVTNGGSPDLNINGSVTPVTFTAAPSITNEEWNITRIGFILDDNGVSNWDDFGAIAGGLTNGVAVQFVIDSTTYTTGLFKNNAELISTSDTVTRGVANAFIGDQNFVAANTVFTIPVLLKESLGDQLKVIVQDDLSGLNLLQIIVTYAKVIS